MNIKLHRNATTTPRIRAEIRASDLPNNQLAEQYGIHPNTVAKWKQREAPHDRSHRPHKLQTTLSEIQEAIVVELRKTIPIPLAPAGFKKAEPKQLDEALSRVHRFLASTP